MSSFVFTVKEFAKFLIDHSKSGNIAVSDLPDLVKDFLSEYGAEERGERK